MLAKAKEDGCTSKMSLFFLSLNIVISFSTGVITAYMASHGCSRAMAAVAVISFIYMVMNFMLIFMEKAWNKCFSWVFLFLISSICLITIVGIGYAAYQSTCDVIGCYSGTSGSVDSFYQNFHGGDKDDFESKYCDVASNKLIGQYVGARIAVYAEVSKYSTDDGFYILKGWPIGFMVLQLILTLMHVVLNFLNLFSCKGCKPQKKEQQYITYF